MQKNDGLQKKGHASKCKTHLQRIFKERNLNNGDVHAL